jgi:hypothetical protein
MRTNTPLQRHVLPRQARLKGEGSQCNGRGPWRWGPMSIRICSTCIQSPQWPFVFATSRYRVTACCSGCSIVPNCRNPVNRVTDWSYLAANAAGSSAAVPPSLTGWLPATLPCGKWFQFQLSVFSCRAWRPAFAIAVVQFQCLFGLTKLQIAFWPCNAIHTSH